MTAPAALARDIGRVPVPGRGSPRPRKLDPEVQLGAASMSAWRDFVRMWKMSGKSPDTLRSYGECLAKFADYLGGPLGTEVIHATQDDAGRWLESMIDAGAADKAIATRHAGVRAVYSWWLKNDITETNPFKGIPQRQFALKLPEVLTDHQLRALAATAENKCPKGSDAEFRRLRDAAILAIWNEAGSPRISEMRALSTADIDLSADELHIRHGKGNKARSIPLSPGTALKLSRYFRARDAYAASHAGVRYGAALWLTATGPITNDGLSKMLRDRAGRAGIGHVHPHQLRHTAYSRFEERGGLPGDAMALFGWSSDTMTRYYGASARARRAAQRARSIALADL